MNCPEFHFPPPKPPRDKINRELFADYGKIGAMGIQEQDGEVVRVFQKQRLTGGQVLCAAGPILPLLPPSNHFPTEEPCLSQIKVDLNDAKHFCHVMRHEGKRETMKLLQNAEVEVFGPKGDGSAHQKTFSAMATIYEKFREKTVLPTVNTRYSGGCITALETTDSQYICVPTGSELNTISLYSMSEEGRPTLTHVASHECKKKIYQIDSTVVDDSCYFGIRSAKGCRLFKLRHLEEGGIQFKRKHRLVFEDAKPMSLSLSPFIEAECVTVTDSGLLQLWDPVRELVGQTCSITQRFADPFFWASAAFSAHPRQLLVTDRTGVSVWDMRMAARSEAIFVLPSPYLRLEERILVGQPHPENPFYHFVATEDSLMMLDHRFPKLPILHWRHTMAASPQYLSIAPGVAPETKNDVILVSCQDEAETLCYQFDMCNAHLPPTSTSQPWRIAKPDDLFHITGSPSLQVGSDLKKQRVSAPLVGVTTLKNRTQPGFCAVQMMSYGDVFGQRFISGDSSMEKTWTSGPGSSHLRLGSTDVEIVNEWHRKLTAQLAQTDKPVTAHTGDVKHSVNICHFPHYLQCHTTQAMAEERCGICSEMNSHGSVESSDETCPRCKLEFGRSHGIRNAVAQCKALPEMVDDELVDYITDIAEFEADIDRYTPALSHILINLWEGNDISPDLIKRRESEYLHRKSNIAQKRNSLEEGDPPTIDVPETDPSALVVTSSIPAPPPATAHTGACLHIPGQLPARDRVDTPAAIPPWLTGNNQPLTPPSSPQPANRLEQFTQNDSNNSQDFGDISMQGSQKPQTQKRPHQSTDVGSQNLLNQSKSFGSPLRTKTPKGKVKSKRKSVMGF